jgi:hypothetical protein
LADRQAAFWLELSIRYNGPPVLTMPCDRRTLAVNVSKAGAMLREQKTIALSLWMLVLLLIILLLSVMAWRASEPSDSFVIWASQSLTCRFGGIAEYCFNQKCENVDRGMIDCQYTRRY